MLAIIAYKFGLDKGFFFACSFHNCIISLTQLHDHHIHDSRHSVHTQKPYYVQLLARVNSPFTWLVSLPNTDGSVLHTA